MPINSGGGGGGSTGGLTQLFDSTLGAGATSIDSGVGGFATTFSTLYIYCTLRGANAVVGSQGASVRFNNDSGGNYYFQRLHGANVTASADVVTAQTGLIVTIADAGNSANAPTPLLLVVHNYGGTTFAKAATLANGFADTSGGAAMRSDYFVCLWNSTAAINRVQVVSTTADNFLTGSRVTILAV